MYRLFRLFRTSIGSKLLAAMSGLVLVLFILGHMLGNMKMFQGQEELNAYAAWLQGHPLLWIFRFVMLMVVAVHLYVGVRLFVQNRRSRPQRYERHSSVQVGIAARSMIYSGLVILAFLVFHLLHLTFGVVAPGHAEMVDAAGRPDVYSRVVLGFVNPWISGFYLIAVAILGLHLHHAIQSLVQTLGFNHETYEALVKLASPALAVLLTLGMLSIPLSVLLGIVQPMGTNAP